MSLPDRSPPIPGDPALAVHREQVIDPAGQLREALAGQAFVVLDEPAERRVIHQSGALFRRQGGREFAFLFAAPLEYAVE